MNFNSIKSAGAIMISNSENSRMLVRLELEGNELEEEGMESLCMSPNLANIEYLNVKQNGIKDLGARSIAIGSMRKLKFLNINQNSISDNGYKAISESE
jgi:Leucine-rich repeat (LRR) protein